MKSEKMFDAHLKSVLENLEVPYDASSWTMLDQKLGPASPVGQSHPVDHLVSNSLRHMEVPFEAAHWDEFSVRLADFRRSRLRVRISKLLEAAIFLLLLANLEGFSDLFSSDSPSSRPLPANVPVAGVIIQPRTKKNLSRRLLVPGDIVLQNAQPGDSPDTGSAGAFAENTSAMQNAAGIAIRPFEAEELSPLRINPVQMVNLSAFNTLDPAALQAVSNSEMPGIPHPIIVKLPRQRRFYVALNTTGDKNFIRSGSDLRVADGYGAGVVVGCKVGNWGFETGLLYDKKDFQPKKVIEIYSHDINGYVGTYASNVNADLVSVPARAMRQVVRAGRLKGYAVAGVTAHVAMQKKYQYNTVVYTAPSSSPGSGPGTSGQPHLKQEAKGILQHGNAAENVYATADLGLRFEQQVGRKLTAFLESSYQNVVGGSRGIGPVASRINTFSIQAGVMASL